MMKKNLIYVAALMGLSLISSSASAWTDCPLSLRSVYTGDGGVLWLFYTNGGSAALTAADPDTKNTLALATAALIASKQVIVRYTANGVACTDINRFDVDGMQLTGN